jgi:hypothetical protein
MNRGLLLTLTESPPAMEEEFNAWYDTEHLPERLAIRGFRSARRWMARCAPGEGKYLATYELDNAAVLQTPSYLARIGEGFSPWSKRCLGRAVVFRRWACEQTEPGDADPHPDTAALVLACCERADSLPLLHLPGVLGARRFSAVSGTPSALALYELENPRFADEVMQALPMASSLERMVRAYVAYTA